MALVETYPQARPPEFLDSVHELIEKRTAQSPPAEAVNSWDGSLTYQELDELSDLLIRTLRRESIEAETVVSLRFEKFKWTIVAILAVMKTVDESTVNLANGHVGYRTSPKGDPRAALAPGLSFERTSTSEHIQRDEKSRVFQSAAFTFDPCMEDMLTTLMVGGAYAYRTRVRESTTLPGVLETWTPTFSMSRQEFRIS
ncbi:hypothetical protein B0O99DRAFT_692459 [Bisporella sp. PMI_857]|nr:hypothetical protein B0O99DRAFT_692459 [Bisporella sp. PMI_857]